MRVVKFKLDKDRPKFVIGDGVKCIFDTGAGIMTWYGSKNDMESRLNIKIRETCKYVISKDSTGNRTKQKLFKIDTFNLRDGNTTIIYKDIYLTIVDIDAINRTIKDNKKLKEMDFNLLVPYSMFVGANISIDRSVNPNILKIEVSCDNKQVTFKGSYVTDEYDDDLVIYVENHLVDIDTTSSILDRVVNEVSNSRR